MDNKFGKQKRGGFMNIKKRMFYSNLLLLIVPIIAILIIVISYNQLFIKDLFSELLESQNISAEEIQTILAPITTFFRFVMGFFVVVFIAVNLFVTRSIAKAVAA
jgi:flagellar biosynthesis protein FlhB